MQTNVYLPQLELAMENVTVTNVRVQEDAYVTAEQPLIEVETGKAVSEVPAPKAGYVRKVFVKPDDQIGDKALLCILTDTLDEPFQDPTRPRLAPAAGPNGGAEDRPSMPVTTTRSELSEGPIKAAPPARKLARDLGIDLAVVVGTGPGGRITVEDVRRTGALQKPQF